MAVKVLMKRVPNLGVWRDMNEILRDLRVLAMSQPGYISGETLISATDQGTTLVISTWMSLKYWRDYENSPPRQSLLDELEPWMAEPATTEVWVEAAVI